MGGWEGGKRGGGRYKVMRLLSGGEVMQQQVCSAAAFVQLCNLMQSKSTSLGVAW